MTKVTVGILGASGYGGAELLRRLAKHPQVKVSAIASRQYEGQPLEACWPQFVQGFDDLRFTSSEGVIDCCETLFSAAPHGTATALVAQAIEAGKKVVDLSADFRLSVGDYATWYGEPHHAPDLQSRAVYGLAELHREEIRKASLVANPGCYPTVSSLALAPLAAAGLLGESVIVNATSGISGAGRGVSIGTHYGELNENYKAYKVAGTHRHTAEVEDTLGRVRSMGRNVRTHGDFDKPLVTFTPHLAPMTRGILATCYTRPGKEGLNDKGLLELYRDFYVGEKLISVQEDLPQTKATYGTDRVHLSVRYDSRTGTVIAIGAEDNLGKGAAGQAVQNFNIMQGFEETAGLELHGVWP